MGQFDMPILLPNIKIKETGTAKGRGVFALREYRAGQTVEICPVIVFQCPFPDLPRELQEHVFDWTVLSQVAELNMQAIALGCGGMYNDCNPANMSYSAVVEHQRPYLQFTAARTVLADEELTVNYSACGGVPESSDNQWFERLGIIRL
jgi:uncharacterized protein